MDNSNIAFEHSGNKAAVFMPRFGQAHQQYFTPEWVADAFYRIAWFAYDLRDAIGNHFRYLSVLDPTAGSGRLLVKFKQANHRVLAIELDGRVVEEATEPALGKRYVREGDILLYASLLPMFKVIVSNPPYGLWWPIEGTAYQDWELGNGRNIESQAFCIELAAKKLENSNGLLMMVLSNKYLDQHPKVTQFVGKYFQVVANLVVPKMFKEEYDIEVDARILVAIAKSPYTPSKEGAAEGEFTEVGDTDALVRVVADAFKRVRPNRYKSSYNRSDVEWLSGSGTADSKEWEWSSVPYLNLVVDYERERPSVEITSRGVQPSTEWARLWQQFYSRVPVQAYDPAQGTYSQIDEAKMSLPAVLITGHEQINDDLTKLGFEVLTSEHNAKQLERRRTRYLRERLPVRELEPVELLAYIADGPKTAKTEGTIGGRRIEPGEVWYLRNRWKRNDEVAKTDEKKGKKGEVVRYVTHISRGHTILYLENDRGDELSVEEPNASDVGAYISTFGVPDVHLVDTLPDFEKWAVELQDLSVRRQSKTAGRVLYDQQMTDCVRMATKGQVALLYEQGGGKTTTAAHWAMLRRYHTVLYVTPASVVPGLIEDLADWGIEARRLTHTVINELKERKRRRKLARRRIVQAAQRREKIACRAYQIFMEAEAEDDPDRKAELMSIWERKDCSVKLLGKFLGIEDRRVELEAILARKRRHLHNLNDIENKGKITSKKAKSDWYKDWERTHLEILDYQAELRRAYGILGYDPPDLDAEPEFFVTSFQDLSLGDHLGIFDAWDHEHYDRDGAYIGKQTGNRAAGCSGEKCNGSRQSEIVKCPQCGKPWRGQGRGGGRICRHCGYRAWTMGTAPAVELPIKRTAVAIRKKLELQKLQRKQYLDYRDYERQKALFDRGSLLVEPVEVEDPFIHTYHSWPMYKRAKNHLLGCVILDEAQDAKTKFSLRGSAARALKANGRAILTGTWMKGYVHDLFWTGGWLMGFGSPLWPFPFHGGSMKFLEQFGTYQWVSKEYGDTLDTGPRKLIPSVANLVRMWRLLGPMTVRRLKSDFLDLPDKHRHEHWLDPREYSGAHADIVSFVTSEVHDICAQETRKAKPNMQRISAALWWARYAASCPTAQGALHYSGAYGMAVNADSDAAYKQQVLEEMWKEGHYLVGEKANQFNKIAMAISLIQEVEDLGDKVIVFTSLSGLYRQMREALEAYHIDYHEIGNAPTKKRNALVRRFENSDATVLLSATGKLNRGITAVGANHVIIMNLEWSPEDTLQAEDRIHRPGQTKECHIHYLLSSGSVDEQMYELVEAKWEAQRAVQDKEARYKDVAEVLEEAAIANAQMAVAKKLTDLDLSAMRDKAKTKLEVKAPPKPRLKAKPVKEVRVGTPALFEVEEDGTTTTSWKYVVEDAQAVKTKGGGAQFAMFG